MIRIQLVKSLIPGWWLLTAVLLFALFWTIRNVAAESSSKPTVTNHLVTIHDGSEERTIVTNARTVRDALKEADVTVSNIDITEPKLDAEMGGAQYNVNIYRARPIVVEDGAARTRVMTAAQSPSGIVEAAGDKLYDEDRTTMQRVDDVVADGGPGLKLSIDRATVFTLVLYGKPIEARTQATTVGEMLKAKGITLAAKDGVSPASETPLAGGMNISVWRNGVQTITLEEAIAMPIRQIKDLEKEPSYKAVQTAGKPGKKQVTYEINMQNGREVSRKMIQSVVSEQPAEQVEVIGGKLPTPTNPTENQALGKQMMLAAGYGESEWPCLYNLWMKESGWRVNAGNPSSGAYGIPQSLPASKMAAFGADYMTSAQTQIKWGLNYIKGRYKTPCGAWSSFQAKNWY